MLAGLRVLVIDDEGDAREFVGQMLEDQGAVVTIARSASEGCGALMRARPDVLVCDIDRPTEDGLALVRSVRQLARRPDRLENARQAQDTLDPPIHNFAQRSTT